MEVNDLDISREGFATELAEARNYAEGLLSRTGRITPHLIVSYLLEHHKKGKMFWELSVPFNEDEEKRSALFNVGRRFYEERKMPVCIFLISEAWLAKDRPGVEPRHCPDRIEVVLVMGCTMAPKFKVFSDAKIHRDANGKMSLPFPFEDHWNAEPILLRYFMNGFLARLTGVKSWNETPGFVA